MFDFWNNIIYVGLLLVLVVGITATFMMYIDMTKEKNQKRSKVALLIVPFIIGFLSYNIYQSFFEPSEPSAQKMNEQIMEVCIKKVHDDLKKDITQKQYEEITSSYKLWFNNATSYNGMSHCVKGRDKKCEIFIENFIKRESERIVSEVKEYIRRTEKIKSTIQRIN